MPKHTNFNQAEALAGLGICESLLIALTDLQIISEKDARNILTDVATAHDEAATVSQTPEKHQAVISPAKTGCGNNPGSNAPAAPGLFATRRPSRHSDQEAPRRGADCAARE